MLESFHQRRDDVLATLRDLMTLAERVGAKSLGAHVGADLVKKLEADRFHLVVVGEFNHGKSTFVNALLGAHVLPVGVTPTTAVIHHLEYSGRAARRGRPRLGQPRDAALRAGAPVLRRRRERAAPRRRRAAARARPPGTR